ncbi:HK97 gp10 family phage protein [Paenibacillus lentus]|uniref:HK97 gp10 family phage protein n=1 Tax=Paenibacillus lentus TaxID=1338368 RepID=A0A3S8RPJ0_9BACL|nr:HK97 gp10 family phage protein [Paenibacillus lentus]AZK44777.1 HK97 gp10 family phage protein [Paenibacillus lentus]
MAKWGKCDFRQLENLQKKLDKLQKVDFEKFIEECAKELAARLLAKVIRRTPVGKKGGTLRRGWTAKTEEEAMFGSGKKAMSNNDALSFAEGFQVNRIGDVYQIEIINPVHYASYVEFGHRTRNHKGWVPGRFMLTISEKELDSQAPKILERKLMNFLGECFDA